MTSNLVAESVCSQLSLEAVSYFSGIFDYTGSSADVLHGIQEQGMKVGKRFTDRLLVRERSFEKTERAGICFIGTIFWLKVFGKEVNAVHSLNGQYAVIDSDFLWMQGCFSKDSCSDCVSVARYPSQSGLQKTAVSPLMNRAHQILAYTVGMLYGSMYQLLSHRSMKIDAEIFSDGSVKFCFNFTMDELSSAPS